MKAMEQTMEQMKQKIADLEPKPQLSLPLRPRRPRMRSPQTPNLIRRWKRSLWPGGVATKPVTYRDTMNDAQEAAPVQGLHARSNLSRFHSVPNTPVLIKFNPSPCGFYIR
jgi:hypothetical protein